MGRGNYLGSEREYRGYISGAVWLFRCRYISGYMPLRYPPSPAPIRPSHFADFVTEKPRRRLTFGGNRASSERSRR